MDKAKEYMNIKTPDELMNFMNRNIIYGVIDNCNKFYDSNSNDFQRICNEEWKFKKGYDVMLSGVGHCWDQTELERDWFSKNDYEYKTLFVFFEHNSEYAYGCHTYLIYKDKDTNKFCWFEHADRHNRGIHSFNSYEECIIAQMNKHFAYNASLGFPMNDAVKSLFRVYEYTQPELESNNDTYWNNIFENGKDITFHIQDAIYKSKSK